MSRPRSTTLRCLIVRERRTRAGIRTEPVPGISGSDALVLHGETMADVFANAASLGLRDVAAIELDDDDGHVALHYQRQPEKDWN